MTQSPFPSSPIATSGGAVEAPGTRQIQLPSGTGNGTIRRVAPACRVAVCGAWRSLASAPALGAGSRRFKSFRPDWLKTDFGLVGWNHERDDPSDGFRSRNRCLDGRCRSHAAARESEADGGAAASATPGVSRDGGGVAAGERGGPAMEPASVPQIEAMLRTLPATESGIADHLAQLLGSQATIRTGPSRPEGTISRSNGR